MIKTIKELKTEGWKQIGVDNWSIEHAKDHYIFYNSKFGFLDEHVWNKRFETNLTSYIKCIGFRMTKSKFFKTYGLEDGKTMILLSVSKMTTYSPNLFYSTENGKKLYPRNMIVTDTDYRKGMSVIVEHQSEKIIARNFDNVIPPAIDKGIMTRTKNNQLLRKSKLENILSDKVIEKDDDVAETYFPLEDELNIITLIDRNRSPFNPDFSEDEINKAKSKIMKEKGKVIFSDLMNELKNK